MQVGIYSRYCRDEGTYAAIRLAQVLVNHDASLYTPDTAGAKFSPGIPVIHRAQQKFTEWGKRQDLIVWFGVPGYEQVKWAKRNGKRTAIVAVPGQVISEHRKVFRLVDVVVSPSRSFVASISSRWGLKRCFSIVWDWGWPLTIKSPPEQETLRLLLPTEFCYPECCRETLFMLDAVLGVMDVSVTITYLPSRWLPHARRQLKRLADRYDGRVALRPSVPFDASLPLLYQNHDITVWPTTVCNFSAAAVLSMSMGTPVVAFAAEDASAVIGTRGGLLVPCEGELSSLGCHTITPNFENMVSHLCGLVADRAFLGKLCGTTAGTVADIRNVFADGWNAIVTPR